MPICLSVSFKIFYITIPKGSIEKGSNLHRKLVGEIEVAYTFVDIISSVLWWKSSSCHHPILCVYFIVVVIKLLSGVWIVFFCLDDMLSEPCFLILVPPK